MAKNSKRLIVIGAAVATIVGISLLKGKSVTQTPPPYPHPTPTPTPTPNPTSPIWVNYKVDPTGLLLGSSTQYLEALTSVRGPYNSLITTGSSTSGATTTLNLNINYNAQGSNPGSVTLFAATDSAFTNIIGSTPISVAPVRTFTEPGGTALLTFVTLSGNGVIILPAGGTYYLAFVDATNYLIGTLKVNT